VEAVASDKDREPMMPDRAADGLPPAAWHVPADTVLGGQGWWRQVEVALLDRAGVIVSVNRGWEDFARDNDGDPARTGVGVSYLDICAGTDDPVATNVAEAVRAAVRGELPVPVVVLAPCHGPSHPRWFDLLVASRFDDAGRCLGATVSLSPALPTGVGGEGASGGAEPRAAAAARQTSARLLPVGLAMLDDPALWSLLEGVGDGLAVVDSAGHLTFVNRTLEIMSGFDRTELLGRAVEALVPDALRARHWGLHEGFRAAPRDRIMGEGAPLVLQRADGRTVEVEIALSAVRISGTMMTAASIRDVSQARADDRLRQSMLVLLEAIPDAVLIMDSQLRVVYANRSAAALRGCEPQDMLSLTIADLDPTLTQQSARELLRSLTTPGEGGGRASREAFFRRVDGTDVPCEVVVRVVDDPVLGQRGIVVARDITGRRAREAAERRRAQASELLSTVTTAVLAGATVQQTHDMVVAGTATVFDADNAAILQPDAASGQLHVVAVSGPSGTMWATEVLPSLRDLDADFAGDPKPGMSLLVASLGREPTGALLGLARAGNRSAFTDDDRVLLAGLAEQVAMAMALGQARVDQQRLDLLEDRQRIARDLHDTVIQDLIAIGMQLQWVLPEGPGPDPDEAGLGLVEQLDAAIRALRGSVYGLSHAGLAGTVTGQVRASLTQASRALGHVPTLTVTGPVDQLSPVVARHLLAALREALSNVTRHAEATTTQVSVSVVPGRLTLTVDDNGLGLPENLQPGSGLSNLTSRAEEVGGVLTVLRRDSGGTRLRWTANTGA
jgi:PAS domain S-box-containing protein